MDLLLKFNDIGIKIRRWYDLKNLRENCLFELNYLLKEFDKLMIESTSYNVARAELLASGRVVDESFIEENDFIQDELKELEERAKAVRRMMADSLARLESTLLGKVTYENYDSVEGYLKDYFDFNVVSLTDEEEREISFDILEVKFTHEELKRKLLFLENKLIMDKGQKDSTLFH